MKKTVKMVMAAALAAALAISSAVSSFAALNIKIPQATGSVVYTGAKSVIDASNASEGYVMIKYNGNKDRIKVQISKGDITYTYDLNAQDRYEVFPLTEKDGTYSIKVMENVSGNQYSQAQSETINVTMVSETSPFLYPNQYCNFSEGSAAVQMGSQITAGCTDELAIVSAVFNWCVDNLSYDNEKAATVQSGYLPNVDDTLATRKGICFDYAALMTSMLRSQGVPTKLVIGYTGDMYHAWVSVYTQSQGWLDDVIFFDGQNWTFADPTFLSSAKRSEEAKSHIGNAANYKAKYSY